MLWTTLASARHTLLHSALHCTPASPRPYPPRNYRSMYRPATPGSASLLAPSAASPGPQPRTSAPSSLCCTRARPGPHRRTYPNLALQGVGPQRGRRLFLPVPPQCSTAQCPRCTTASPRPHAPRNYPSIYCPATPAAFPWTTQRVPPLQAQCLQVIDPAHIIKTYFKKCAAWACSMTRAYPSVFHICRAPQCPTLLACK